MPDFDKQHAKYQHDQELLFKTTNRRNKLFGLWAAERMALPEERRGAYAVEVVQADFERPGDDDVLEKVEADLKAKGIDLPRAELRRTMDELMVTARHQIDAEAEKARRG